MNEYSQPPYFESLPVGTEWDCLEKDGRPPLWIPRMPIGAPLPSDVVEYILSQLESDLNAMNTQQPPEAR